MAAASNALAMNAPEKLKEIMAKSDDPFGATQAAEQWWPDAEDA